MDDEGIKHIVVHELQNESVVYDHIESDTIRNASKELEVLIFLDNKPYVRVFDFEHCNDNSEVNFLKNSFKISDLDHDGVKEVTFLYDLICNDDFYPAGMKLIMIEGDQKYKIRGGKMFFVMDNGELMDERLSFNIDPSFNNAPESFLNFATHQWNNNLFDPRVGELTEMRKKIQIIKEKEILDQKEKFIQENQTKSSVP